MEAQATRIWDRLTASAAQRGACLWLLLDPEKLGPTRAAAAARLASELGCDALLVGGSTCAPDLFADTAREVMRASGIPVLIFPNGADHVVPDAHAILFLSLLSGRNPDYLVGEQVRGAPRIFAHGLEAIPTGYLLIESGRRSAVEEVSGTRPIPRDDVASALAHAQAACCLGMQLLYLEAGSGAPKPVPLEMISACRSVGLPVTVGGGIATPEAAADRVAAGAQFIVIGTRFEAEPDGGLLGELVDAVHVQAPIES